MTLTGVPLSRAAELGRLRGVALEQVGQPEQHRGPLGRGSAAHAGCGGRAACHGGVDVARPGQAHLGLHLPGGRVPVVVVAPAVARPPRSPDQVALGGQPRTVSPTPRSSSRDHVPAVDRQGHPEDERRGRRAQPHRGLGDLCGLADSADRVQRLQIPRRWTGRA